MLPEEARVELLSIARRTIEGFLRDGHAPALVPRHPTLIEKRGAFVTLHAGDELRGCIGHTQARHPLWETVRDVAVLAATDDPRFEPMTPEELGRVRIEISVLSPMERVPDPAAIRVGTHGLYVKRGMHSGLLLPQVAPEWGWNREEFIEHTCRKADLPRDAWKDPKSELFWFTAEVFGEPRLEARP